MPILDTILLLTGILVFIGVLSSKISARIGVPSLVLFMGVGLLAGEEGIGGIAFDDYQIAYAVGSVALALILFDGGLRTSVQDVRRAWKPAAALATGGVLATAGITGAAAYWIMGITWQQSFLLGAIISSTDAAAVFSILRGKGVALTDRLRALLEIESGSNDPMAVFLTVAAIEIILGKLEIGLGMSVFFFQQMVVGAIIGVAIGWVGAVIINRINLDAAGLYPVLATVIGLISFGLTAKLGGSGFLAIYFTGIVIGNKDVVFERGIFLFHDGIAWTAQIIMFTLLGILSSPSSLLTVAPQGLLISVVLIFVARPLVVFTMVPWFGFNFRELIFISWVGLKGAVPIILAVYPLLFDIPDATQIFNVIFFVVLVSALLQGWSLPVVARWLGLQQTAKPEAPASLEITALRHLNAEIVNYAIGVHSTAIGYKLRELPLPEGVLVAMVTRGNKIVPPTGGTTLLDGDHAFIVLQHDYRPLVDRLFVDTSDNPQPLPQLVDYVFKARIQLEQLSYFYDIELPNDANTTLAELAHSKLGENLAIGDWTDVGPWILVVRELEDGHLAKVVLNRGYIEQIKKSAAAA